METWGELFWDAWIRLRLWCRSLYRTYWPPQIKAWQVCTVTGIVSVILTLVALSYQPSAKTLAEGKPGKATGKPVNPKVALESGKLAAQTDPFADLPVQELGDDKMLAGVDDISPDGATVVEHPDPGFEPIGGRRHKKSQPAGEEIAATDIGEAQPTTDLTPLPATEQTAPEAAEETPLTLPPDVPETMPAEPQAETPAPDLFQDPVVTEAPVTEAVPAESITEPVSEPVADAPEPVTHAPLMTKIKSSSPYSRLGKGEDSEEDRHSVRDIRPTHTKGVPIPERAHRQSVVNQTTPALKMPVEESELIGVPESDTTPAVPAQENPADNLTLPPAEAVPAEAVPDESVPQREPAPATLPEKDQFDQEQPAKSDVAAETDEGPSPPVLIVPEATGDLEGPDAKGREYHGPVLSTEGADHEAHQEEDVFSRTKRKTPLLSDPPPVRPTQPAVPGAVEHHDIKDPGDHEVHTEEDVFSKTKSKTPLLSDPPPVRSTQPTEPSIAERRKPVEPAPVTIPRTAPRAAPREIHDDEDSRPSIDIVVPKSRVVPMAVPDATRQRGPERITVPDRMPPVAPPVETVPRGRQESSFAVPPTTQSVRPETAPRLVMAITGPKQAPVGTQVVWHFKIQNMGSVPATGIVVSDVLPPGLQHRLSPDLEYTIDRLEPGESRETNLTVQCASAGTITNRAVLRADGDLSTEAEIQIEVTGSSPANSVPSGKSPLTLAHHGPERWLVDSTGQFLVTVTNTSQERLRNVTIRQSYPQGTNLVHATLGSKVDAANRTVTWTIPEFAPGASYILETELHCLAGGTGTSSVRVKVGETLVAEDRWTAVSFIADGRR